MKNCHPFILIVYSVKRNFDSSAILAQRELNTVLQHFFVNLPQCLAGPDNSYWAKKSYLEATICAPALYCT